MYNKIIFDLDDTLTDDRENIKQAFKIVLEHKRESYTDEKFERFYSIDKKTWKDRVAGKLIIERGLGDWENTPTTDEKQLLMHNKIVPPNGETFKEFDSRILEFLEMLRNNYKDKNILVITHAGVIYGIYRILGLKVKAIENLEMLTIEF